MSTIKEEAVQALAAKGEAEQNLARLPLCPPSRKAAFAATMATLIGTPALPLRMRLVALALICASVYLIMQWDKRRLGVFINGYRRGKTRMVIFPMFVLIVGLDFASTYFSVWHKDKEPWASLALAGVAFIIGYLGCTLWQRIFVSELSA
jgi:hypothetical protein